MNAQEYLRPGLLQLPSLPPLSLYVHLPWCLKKCPYCDFNSHGLSSSTASAAQLQRGLQARYIQALLADLEAALPLIWGRTVRSIFIGGGTPSLFEPEYIDELLSHLRARLMLSADVEITLEANPGTFECERFRAFRQAGINRLSIGVQSFNDRHLQALGRVHSANQAKAALAEAADCFDTFNLDLMYALPQQTLDELAQDLEMALSFKPPHLSIYHLTIEPNTYFAKHPPAVPCDDIAYSMLDMIVQATQAAGLQRYEVSAFARAGHRCRHNLNYWEFGDYLGIGAGAHSKISFPHRIIRQIRTREPSAYMEKALISQAVSASHEIKRQDLPFEFMLGALRLRDGVPLNDLYERTGQSPNVLSEALQTARSKGLMDGRDETRLKATDLGFDFLSDLQSLFLPIG